MNRFRRLAVVAALFVPLVLPPAGLTGRAEAKQVYEWTDKDGTYHVTDEFSKVPAEYRDRTTVRGTKVLATTVNELVAQNPLVAGRPGHKVVVLEPVKSAFELPELFSTEKGTWNSNEEFKLLGHATGSSGQLYFSNQSVDLEIIEYSSEAATSRVCGMVTAFKLIGDYLKEHPGESVDRLAAIKTAVIVPSGHMAVSFNSARADTKQPLHVQFVMGPYGTSRLRWSGPESEYDPLTQETLASWRSTVEKKFVLDAVSLDDLKNPWVMGGVIVILVLVAALTTTLIVVLKKTDS